MAPAFEVNCAAALAARIPRRAMPFLGLASGAGTKTVALLERKIGQQTLEIDFLKGCLQRMAKCR